MAYIGRDTDKISNIEKLDTITFDGSSSYTLQKNSVNFTPNSANSLQVSIDGVVQAGNFTVSGSTIDFGVAIPATSTCDFIFHYGTGLVTTVADGAITTAKLADSSVSLAKLTATGTKDATTFLRGDNTFATPAGGTNTPAFFAYHQFVQNFSQNVDTKLQFNTELFDTDNSYDNATNYRFTPQVAGKYYISAGAYIDGTTTSSPTGLKIFKNGSFYHQGLIYSGGLAGAHHIHNIINLNGSSDYVEIFVQSGNASPFINFAPGSTLSTFFCAYKLIGA